MALYDLKVVLTIQILVRYCRYLQCRTYSVGPPLTLVEKHRRNRHLM